MKILLEIKEEKVAFVMELLNNFKFVRVKPLSDEKAKLIEDLKDAVEEVKLIKEGKKKGVELNTFLGEL